MGTRKGGGNGANGVHSEELKKNRNANKYFQVDEFEELVEEYLFNHNDNIDVPVTTGRGVEVIQRPARKSEVGFIEFVRKKYGKDVQKYFDKEESYKDYIPSVSRLKRLSAEMLLNQGLVGNYNAGLTSKVLELVERLETTNTHALDLNNLKIEINGQPIED